MEQNDFYVYEWFNTDTDYVFYVGKGHGHRYKDLYSRNKLFLEYLENNSVDVRIIKNNLTEKDALLEEKLLIEEYKKNNQCSCNLMEGGTGGLSFIWTPEMKEYWSEHNPMKEDKQRQRMIDNNPMKNPEIVKKVGKKNKRAVVLDGIQYEGIIDAAQTLHVDTSTIANWCKRGYNTDGKPCRYADEEQNKFVLPAKGKAVIIDKKDYYPTVKDAAIALGSKDSSPLCKALKLGIKYKGHICEYANQQPSQ